MFPVLSGRRQTSQIVSENCFSLLFSSLSSQSQNTRGTVSPLVVFGSSLARLARTHTATKRRTAAGKSISPAASGPYRFSRLVGVCCRNCGWCLLAPLCTSPTLSVSWHSVRWQRLWPCLASEVTIHPMSPSRPDPKLFHIKPWRLPALRLYNTSLVHRF